MSKKSQKNGMKNGNEKIDSSAPNSSRNSSKTETKDRSDRPQNNRGTKGANLKGKESTYSKCGQDKLGPRGNRIEDFNKIPSVYDPATRIPFNQVFGYPLDLLRDKNEMALLLDDPGLEYSTIANAAVPGLCVIKYSPTLGTAIDDTSPVNRANVQMFGDIYSKTSGNLQMTQSDLSFYNGSLSSMITVIGVIQRALEIVGEWEESNGYWPKAFFAGMKIDYDDTARYKSNYLTELNDLIGQFNALSSPNLLDIYERHYEFAHNIYLDDENPTTSQYYLFMPDVVYRYDDVNNILRCVSTPYFSPSESKITDWLEVLRGLLNAVQHSDAYRYIKGAFQRAYSGAPKMAIRGTFVEDMVTITYDQHVLWSIQNSLMLPVQMSSVNENVIKDVLSTSLTLNPSKYHKFLALQDTVPLCSYDGNISDEFIMEATRFMPALEYVYSDGSIRYKSYGTEVLKACKIVYADYVDEIVDGVTTKVIKPKVTEEFGSLLLQPYETSDEFYGILCDTIDILNLMEPFHWMPRVYPMVLRSLDEGVANIRAFRPTRCTQVTTNIGKEDIAGLNKAALLSQYSVVAEVHG